ncbi:hypothetical protein CRE_06362 [Caenorhabditis remanei]|uniref:Peptidase M13 C-terminal domain-containing protein n=1 Tax=Caenorhabditis remanei TaxID=31234 RepID=E3M1Q4_CAERE|nr:hypothetical protein CRE_06362 [Caenorhabditis remanei]
MSLGVKKNVTSIDSPYVWPQEDLASSTSLPPWYLPSVTSRPTVKAPEEDPEETPEEAPEGVTPEVEEPPPKETPEPVDARPTCLTETCLKEVDRMKFLINESVSPCDNFFQHACTNFDLYKLEKKDVPTVQYNEDEVVKRLSKIGDFLEHRLHELVLPSEVNLRKLYLKCLRRDHRDVEDLLKTLRHDLWWPFDWVDQTKYDRILAKILTSLVELNPSNIHLFNVVGDHKQLIIRSAFCHGNHKSINVKIVKQIFDAVSKDPENEDRKLLEKSLELALKMDLTREYCTEMAPPQNRNQEFIVNYTIPSIDIPGVFADVLNPSQSSRPSKTRTKVEQHLIFKESHEFFNSTSFFNEMVSSRRIEMVHYLVIKYVEEMATEMLLSPKSNCVKIAMSLMPRTAFSVYINHFLQPENLHAIPHLINSVKSQYFEMIQKSKKIDDKTRSMLIKRLTHLRPDIGSHGIGISENSILEKVEDHTGESFFKVYTRMNIQKSRDSLGYMVLDDMSISGKTHAISSFNQRVRPGKMFAYMMANPRFDISYPTAAQYGKGGHDVATDMAYIFQALRMKPFRDTLKCFPNEERFGDLNMFIDYIGIKASYDAYKKADKSKSDKFPGFHDMSDDQLFFYSMVQSTCQEKSDAHGQRVNFLLQQLDGFGEAFNCPADANMVNPKTKCGELL